MKLNTLIELCFSLFDAVIFLYFVSRFNDASISPRKNKLLIPALLVIFGFSIINDLLLSGFSVLGTVIFLVLYIAYAIGISSKKYVRAIVSACIFEVVFVLLSSILYFAIGLFIKDTDQLLQGSSDVIRYVYIIMHKIALFVVLKFILMAFKARNKMELKHGIIALIFSFTTILGLGATMHMSFNAPSTQLQAMVIAIAFTLCNVILYLLIYQVQKHQQKEYELRLLNERVASTEARHKEITVIWEQARKLQHDMRLHLGIINEYLEKNEVERSKEYINELLPKIQGQRAFTFAENPILEYLINSRLSPLTDTEIVISGSIGDLSDIKDSDLLCLVGNILDNAVEAIARVKRDKKRIELLFLRQNSNRIIICKNTIEKSVLDENSELKTTKAPSSEHGYGTKIIAKIVSDYGGMVDYFEEFNMFGVQVILP